MEPFGLVYDADPWTADVDAAHDRFMHPGEYPDPDDVVVVADPDEDYLHE